MTAFHGTEVAMERSAALIAADSEVRAAQADEQVLAALADEGRPSIELIAQACRAYAGRPCLGERKPEADRFSVTTFGVLWQRVRDQASGWSELVHAGDFVGICGFASIDFVVADLACLYAGVISVPLQTVIGKSELEHIVGETEMRCVACSVHYLSSVEPALGRIEKLIVLDVDPADREALARVRALARPGLSVYVVAELEAAGRARGPIPFVVGEPDRMVSILYTSGTTGSPKGAIYLDRIWARRMRYALREPAVPAITVGALPLNHVMGRFSVYRTLMRGGVTHFVARSDMSTLFEDIRIVRPTVLTLVPRATAAIYQHFQAQVVQRTEKLGAIAAAEEVMAEMRAQFLGDRLCLVMTASAATPPETIVFLERCFGISMIQFYAFNEFGGVTANERVEPDVEYRLVDVPELGYSVNDKPYPRGELEVRARFATPGYYKRADTRGALFTDDGFMRSGDIMEERGTGHIVWIDRRNNVIKLAQGEFVSLTRLEELFATGSPYIRQIHLHGSSQRSYLLAVIVPDRALAATAGVEGDDALVRLLRTELDRIARTAVLPRHEVPREVIVEDSPFDKESGLLTESGKPKRRALQEKYGARLEALYGELEARQLQGAITTEGGPAAVIAGALGNAKLDLSQSFVGMGGDSFGAVRLSTLLKSSYGFSPPVGALLDPRTSLASVVAEVERHAGTKSPSMFARIHGDAPTRVAADALALDRFLPRGLLDRPAPTQVTSPPAVLLTGATGFLGRFLLLELLERGASRVVCVVRGDSDEAAMKRLRHIFEPADEALRLRFERHVASGRLMVVGGDLMRPQLGMTEQKWRSLADEIDTVVHNGALVNHALPYAELFEPNVLGTVEAIRFVLQGRGKSLAFVSSSGVAAGLQRAILEDEQAAELWPSRSLASDPAILDYAGGYATSKWAAEILLRELGTRGTAVQVFRCAMILPHGKYVGQVNEGDNITRLLRGLVATGIAPASFYRQDVTQRHFDGIAVEHVAASIAAIALEAAPGHHNYHVSNAGWDDGVSLDTFADAVAGAGYTLQRTADYQTWFSELRARLEKLTEVERRRSPLPIIARWQHEAGPEARIRLDNTRFRAKLRALLGLDDVPSLDEAYLRHCVLSVIQET